VYDLGIRHFDTAQIYGKGYSEILLGNWVRPFRKEVLITTKFGLGDSYSTSFPALLAMPLNFLRKKWKSQPPRVSKRTQEKFKPRIISYADIQQDLNESLTRLKTNYIDFYLLHEGLPGFVSDEGMTFLNKMKQEGIIKKIGIAANRYNTASIQSNDLVGWDVVQYDATIHEGKLTSPANISLLTHFHHSTLNNYQLDDSLNFLHADEKPGYILAKSIKNNPGGKVIFATRNVERLKKNLAYFKQHIQLF
jgi:hypothetical protein